EIERVKSRGRFTVTMENELDNLLIYYKLRGENILNILKKYRDIEIKDKRESKRILEEIRERI
ncbi:MAG: spore photoproduct lyase, partial [Candidatus Fusobacterium pullicola]|nr:spore photoproduct lyase [Candidatus Fusobacterium pullicola]